MVRRLPRLGRALVLLTGALVAGAPRLAAIVQDTPSILAGRWTLNRPLSTMPREVGFAADFLSAAGSDGTTGGGRGRRGSTGGSGPATNARPLSEDEARRLQLLTAEVRNPAVALTISESASTITLAADQRQTRTVHPTGREEILQGEAVALPVTARRIDGGRLVVTYTVDTGRTIRYTYARTDNPTQLVVDIELIGRGGGDVEKLVYVPAPPEAPRPAEPPRDASARGVTGSPAAAPATPTAPNFDQRPGAELRGLTALGIVVEDLSSQAIACGLNQTAVETAVSKHLSDAGFSVRRNSDEDTYLYVHIITTGLGNGQCVSRYDTTLYTHTTATLSFQRNPVLVEVSLLHKGGISGGTAAAHAAAVMRDIQDYVDQFVRQIRDANR